MFLLHPDLRFCSLGAINGGMCGSKLRNLKLAIIAPSLDSGVTGVGDYARLLAEECTRAGHIVRLVSLNETAPIGPEREGPGGIGVGALRLQSSQSWKSRWGMFRAQLNGFQPDALSLQFVSFGFQSKGLISPSFGRNLRAAAGRIPVQVMFHEIWLGVRRDASFKHRLWGGCQRALIVRMLKQLKPALIQSQCDPYCWEISRLGWQVSKLPLFGNIPIHAESGHRHSRRSAFLERLKSMGGESEYWIIGLFGSLHPEWSAQTLMDAVCPIARSVGKRVLFLLFGRHGRSEAEAAGWAQTCRSEADWRNLGALAAEDISRIMQLLDFGTVSTPLAMLDKSGAAAAFFDHGVPVVVTRDDCRFRLYPERFETSHERYCLAGERLATWMIETSPRQPSSSLQSIAQRFLEGLEGLQSVRNGDQVSHIEQ